ncbi:MAG TPA: hypothetical protein ENN07_02710 [candidate division Zixibacteria bacterium]|nr:hypothetical protein [candidate division Zixibacteria bacterium]
MNRFMKHVLALTLLSSLILANVAGSWKIHADAHFAQRTATLDGGLFVGTKGGLIHYNPIAESMDILTNLDGLGDLHITGLAVHGDKLYYSGANGAVGRLDGIRFRTNSDLVRSKIAANDLISAGNHLFVATSQGISKLNVLESHDPVEIAENYTKLGSFERNIPVTRISADDTLIWAATESGIAFGRLSGNLFIPDEWRNIETDRAVSAILADSGGTWFALERESGMPTIFWTDGEIIDTVADAFMDYRRISDLFYYDGVFHASGTDGLFFRRPTGNFGRISVDWHWAVHGGVDVEGELFVGMEIGFGVLRADTIRSISPNTPWGNGFADMAFGPHGDMWVISQNLGMMHRQDGNWDAYITFTIPLGDSLMNIVRGGIFSSYSITLDGDGALWIGTNGRGVFRRTADGDWKVYNNTNSVLQGISDAPSVVVCRAIAYDRYRDVIWVTNYAGTGALLVAAFDPRGDLDAPIVSYYSGASGIPNNNVHGIAVGERAVWLVLKDIGVVEISLGAHLDQTSDDLIYLYRDNLPSSAVNQIAIDSEGRAWLAANGE